VLCFPPFLQDRDHLDFVAPLCRLLPCTRSSLVDQLCGVLEAAGFRVQEAGIGEADQALAASKLCGTRLLDVRQLLAEDEQRRRQQQQEAAAACIAAGGA
jgi:hypothetical protein